MYYSILYTIYLSVLSEYLLKTPPNKTALWKSSNDDLSNH